MLCWWLSAGDTDGSACSDCCSRRAWLPLLAGGEPDDADTDAPDEWDCECMTEGGRWGGSSGTATEAASRR